MPHARTNSHAAHVPTRVLHHMMMLFHVTRRALATKPSSRFKQGKLPSWNEYRSTVIIMLLIKPYRSTMCATSPQPRASQCSTACKSTQLHTMSAYCFPSKLANSVGNKMTCHPRAPSAQSYFTCAHIQWLNHLHACESQDSANEGMRANSTQSSSS